MAHYREYSYSNSIINLLDSKGYASGPKFFLNGMKNQEREDLKKEILNITMGQGSKQHEVIFINKKDQVCIYTKRDGR